MIPDHGFQNLSGVCGVFSVIQDEGTVEVGVPVRICGMGVGVGKLMDRHVRGARLREGDRRQQQNHQEYP